MLGVCRKHGARRLSTVSHVCVWTALRDYVVVGGSRSLASPSETYSTLQEMDRIAQSPENNKTKSEKIMNLLRNLAEFQRKRHVSANHRSTTIKSIHHR